MNLLLLLHRLLSWSAVFGRAQLLAIRAALGMWSGVGCNSSPEGDRRVRVPEGGPPGRARRHLADREHRGVRRAGGRVARVSISLRQDGGREAGGSVNID